jgi:tetratricopeptide (TPR) repeat protein
MTKGETKDFFVSFNKADRAWAEWIAWILEEAGYSVLFQHWDFKGNFVLEIDRAHKETRRTIAVISPDYLTSAFTAPEWAARFAEDARSEHDRLIPVRVRECELSGLLAQIIYVDLIGTHRSDARQRLLDRVAGIRLKPKEEPFFPGGPLPLASRTVGTEPRFPVAVNNLPPINPDFVGREAVLAELRRLLVASPGPAVLTQAITGLGGIGKSQTARAYAYRHLADYELIWWLRAETPATLAADYAALAEPLGLDPDTADQPKLIAAVRQRLQSRSGWLLILDNVEDPALPREWLPGTGGGHALITSRRTDWRERANVLNLALMSEDDALLLLTGRLDPKVLPPAELGAAMQLAAELGYLPLALAQAQAYMSESGRNLASYLQLFRTSLPSDFAADTPGPDYPASYATTWLLSIEAAEAACLGARPLLEILAFLAPEPLPIEVLSAAPAVLPPTLHSERARDDAIAALRRYSLVHAEGGMIEVHRLVQAVTRDRLSETTKRNGIAAAIQLMDTALPRPASAYQNWAAFSILLPHILMIADAAVQIDVEIDTVGKIFSQVALYYGARGAWHDSLHFHDLALHIAERLYGRQDLVFALSLSNLAAAEKYIGRLAEAENHFRHALNIAEAVLGTDSTEIALWVNNLGESYREVGRYAEAEPLLRRVVEIGEKSHRQDDPALATWINNLGLVLHATGQLEEAERLFRRALALNEKYLGPDHPDVATRLSNLALLLKDTNRLVEAEAALHRAIRITEKTLGSHHPFLLIRVENLARLYWNTDRHAEAEPLLQHCVAIAESAFGPDDFRVAVHANNLAQLYHDTKQFNRAEPLLLCVLSVCERKFGSDHFEVGTIVYNLALLYRDMSRYVDAKPLFQRAIGIFESILPPEDSQLKMARASYAALLADEPDAALNPNTAKLAEDQSHRPT